MRTLLGLLVLLAGCRTTEQWQAALYSGQLGYTDIGGNWSLNKQGDRHGDTQMYGITYTLTPGQWWIMNMQAEMNARAATEAAYACRPPPPPPAVPPKPACERPK